MAGVLAFSWTKFFRGNFRVTLRGAGPSALVKPRSHMPYTGIVLAILAFHLAAFLILLGHWLEMRARAGASKAVQALLSLAPPKATVIRSVTTSSRGGRG